MAKSVGNIALLHEVLDQYGRDAVVLYLVSGHYRQPLAFGEDALAQADASARRIREAARRLAPGPSPAELAPLRQRFLDALADDFNTPRALQALFDWVREANGRPQGTGGDDLAEMLGLLGLEGLLERSDEAPAEVVDLAAARLRARADGDYGEADRLRDEIAERGWIVRDTPGGFSLVPR